jgi:hypothetical protein
MNVTTEIPMTFADMKKNTKDFWTDFIMGQFPEASFNDSSVKWVEKFRFDFIKEEPVVKLYEYEISRKAGCFIELIEKKFSTYQYIHNTERILYRYRFDPKDLQTGKVVKAKWLNKSKNEEEEGFMIRLSDLEEISRQSSALPKAVLSNGFSTSGFKNNVPDVPTSPRPEYGNNGFKNVTSSFLNDEEEEDYTEKPDDHMTKMTIRDNYCITHGVPRSNKPWLNKLIIEGNKWLAQQQQNRQ